MIGKPPTANWSSTASPQTWNSDSSSPATATSPGRPTPATKSLVYTANDHNLKHPQDRVRHAPYLVASRYSRGKARPHDGGCGHKLGNQPWLRLVTELIHSRPSSGAEHDCPWHSAVGSSPSNIFLSRPSCPRFAERASPRFASPAWVRRSCTTSRAGGQCSGSRRPEQAEAGLRGRCRQLGRAH